jgi:hypothetical protein
MASEIRIRAPEFNGDASVRIMISNLMGSNIIYTRITCRFS